MKKDLTFVKDHLQGIFLVRLLKKNGITKYRLHKETGISWQTLCSWHLRKAIPSDKLALIAGRRLGLIPDKNYIRMLKTEITERIEEIKARQEEIDKLEKRG